MHVSSGKLFRPPHETVARKGCVNERLTSGGVGKYSMCVHLNAFEPSGAGMVSYAFVFQYSGRFLFSASVDAAIASASRLPFTLARY